MTQFFSKLVAPESGGTPAGRDPLVVSSGESFIEPLPARCSLRNGTRLLETAAAVALLIVLSSAPYIELPRFLNRPLTTSSWTYIYPYWATAILSCVAVARWIERNGVGRALRRPLALIASLATLIVVSSIWADAAFSLPLDALLVALLLSAGVWFGISLDLRQWAIAVYISSQALVVASLFEIWLRPRFGISLYLDWMGVFGNRNTLAPIAGLGAVASFGLWVVYRYRWLIATGVASAALDLFVLYKSGNTTTWISLATAAGLLVTASLVALLTRSDPVTRRVAPRAKAPGFALMAGIGLAGLCVVASNIHRSSSLNDRRRLWSYLWNTSAGHRWLGYGFGSFWRDDAKVLPISTAEFRWDAAHNSFVEIYIGLGIVGLALVMGLLVLTAWHLYERMRIRRSLASVVPAMLFAFLLMENLSESMILYNSSIWVLLVAVACFGLDERPPLRSTLDATSVKSP